MLVFEIKNEGETNLSQVPSTQSCQTGFDHIRKSNTGEETEVKRQVFLHAKKDFEK